MYKSYLRGAACACLVVFTQTASAASISFSSGLFDASFDINADDSGDFSSSNPVVVTGLQQFDPTLGMLTGVSFSVSSGDFTWNADLFGDPMTGSLFDGEFQGSLQADLLYSTGASSIVLDFTGADIDLICSGVHPDPCDDSVSDSSIFGIDSFVIPRTLSEFVLADIVGTGDVANLSLSIDSLGISFPQNSGLNFIEASGMADITGATVSVTYDYSVVPVPAAVWLFGTGLAGLVAVARRKNSRA